jgi:hypothetical protein
MLMHEGSMAWEHMPASPSTQVSMVQAMPSSQFTGVPAAQASSVHRSAPLQRSPSSQSRSEEHERSATQPMPARHTLPAPQRAFCATFTHCPEALQVSSVHSRRSSQSEDMRQVPGVVIPVPHPVARQVWPLGHSLS